MSSMNLLDYFKFLLAGHSLLLRHHRSNWPLLPTFVSGDVNKSLLTMIYVLIINYFQKHIKLTEAQDEAAGGGNAGGRKEGRKEEGKKKKKATLATQALQCMPECAPARKHACSAVHSTMRPQPT